MNLLKPPLPDVLQHRQGRYWHHLPTREAERWIEPDLKTRPATLGENWQRVFGRWSGAPGGHSPT